jgi:hypothetical protein
LAAHTQKTCCADQDGNRPTQEHNLSVETDTARHDCSQAQERCQVEDVRTKDNPGAYRRLVVPQRRNGGRDLGRIGREGCHYAEQGFGESEALTNSLESRDEDPTDGQTDDCSDHESYE